MDGHAPLVSSPQQGIATLRSYVRALLSRKPGALRRAWALLRTDEESDESMLKNLLRSPVVRVALLVACGTALLPSCAGGGLPPVSVFLLAGVVALGGWLSACSRTLNPPNPMTGPDAATGGTGGTDAAVEAPGTDAAVDVPSLPRCLTDADFDDSQPYAEGAGPGWTRCCLRGETRLCPTAPTVSCNYGLGTTFNPDGTCGWAFGDAAVDAASDASTPADAAADAPSDATVADASPEVTSMDGATSCSVSCYLPGSCFDSSLPFSGEIPAGWARCCLGGQARLCLSTGNLACNFGLATWCADGTCRAWMTSCEPADASDANATAP